MILLTLVACNLLAGPPIPQVAVDQIASELAGVGHPNSTFLSGEITDWRAVPKEEKSADRWIDVDIRYQRPKEATPDTMKVRLYLVSAVPCKVKSDVIADTGPTPVLLDNGLVSKAVGRAICDAMGG